MPLSIACRPLLPDVPEAQKCIQIQTHRTVQSVRPTAFFLRNFLLVMFWQKVAEAKLLCCLDFGVLSRNILIREA